jgi:hypothetical protein
LLAKIYGSNPSFQCQILQLKRLSGWGRTRTRGEGGTNERKLGQGNLAVAFESKVSAKIHGSEVGAKICASDLDAMICGSELGAKICDADVPATSPPHWMPRRVTSEPRLLAPTLQGPKISIHLQGAERKFSLKKDQIIKSWAKSTGLPLPFSMPGASRGNRLWPYFNNREAGG